MSDDKKKISLPIVGDEEEGSEQESSNEENDVLDRIDRQVSENDVVLYMKGTPQQPMCGFSARAAQILQVHGVDFHSVNVLEDDDVREGIKEYASWKTIPQLYIDGEFVGGSDIMMKMHESGELDEKFGE